MPDRTSSASSKRRRENLPIGSIKPVAARHIMPTTHQRHPSDTLLLRPTLHQQPRFKSLDRRRSAMVWSRSKWKALFCHHCPCPLHRPHHQSHCLVPAATLRARVRRRPPVPNSVDRPTAHRRTPATLVPRPARRTAQQPDVEESHSQTLEVCLNNHRYRSLGKMLSKRS